MLISEFLSDGMADPASYGNYDRDIEQALIILKKGSQLVKYCRKGKPKVVPFRLSADETKLIWLSHGKEKSLKLSSVSRIVPGQRTAVFRRYLRPEKDYLSFSLIYKKGERSLDLICKDKAEVEVWFAGLNALISSGHNSKRPRSEFTDDCSDFAHNERPFGVALEFASTIARGRFSVDSSSHESSLDSAGSDVAPEASNMPLRTSGGDGSSRISVSSVGCASSVLSGQDDIESLGDVFIWGRIWAHGASHDGFGSQVLSTKNVLTPKSLESNIVIDVHQIGCGVHHIALITRQGEVFTWGDDSGGRLGHGLHKNRGRLQLVESLAVTSVGFVACGEYHTCALSTHGDIFTWGDDIHNAGLLGHGTEVSHWIPKKIGGPLDGLLVVSVACGTWHSALVTSIGKLFTFGDGKFGVLGHGDRDSVSYPKEVRLMCGQRAIKVACGVWHTAAIIEVVDHCGTNASSSRKLFTWGDGDQYRLGHASKDTYLQPTCVSALSDYSFHQVACGTTMTVALTASGQVFTMGETKYGQLGNPMSNGRTPSLVKDNLVGEVVEEISCGSHHVAVVTSKGELYTWGRGANGRLGHGDTDDHNTPILVEAFRDRHVKHVSCGSSFTFCVCIHKWISGADQSLCSGCRQPFGFTRKRHNCYNCGLVYCHPCSSKKSIRAALAPTPSKPHRVCDSCYSKLKVHETSSASSTYNKDVTRAHRKERFDTREAKNAKILSSRSTDPVKYFETLTGKNITLHDFSSTVRVAQAPLRIPMDDVFPSSSSVMQNASVPITQSSQPPTPPTPSNLRPPSPYARRPSPPRSTSPGFSRSLIDSLKKTNDLLNQEVSKLKNQNQNLKQKSDMQDIKIRELEKKIEESTSLIKEESSKHRILKEYLQCMTDQLREVTENLPPVPDYESLITLHTHAETFLKENMEFKSLFASTLESKSQSANDIHGADNDSRKQPEQKMEETVDAAEAGSSMNGGNALQESNESSLLSPNKPRSSNPHRPGNEKQEEIVTIEQFERGVYVTFVELPSGGKVFKRIRFSKRKFDETQAAEWWNQNKDRVLMKYSPESVQDAATGSSISPTRS
ncbi:hypothetical protein HN51_047397 [Arachis hypogaea]|uniref:FYVE-type domain-containing protein n=1 Tax=Arachis hypogaea TaxID=3818 RepID=A0A445AGP5_ARAHY|nr:uncharacterized protein LOC107627150 [Arachis ipaensis]QHO23751.1 putative E3 ubiquitin-protein ligase [Arachis hypogaea]RYR25582.1 hypothetical protein Ahy_B02g059388 isoform A [Arachis hypogaea]